MVTYQHTRILKEMTFGALISELCRNASHLIEARSSI